MPDDDLRPRRPGEPDSELDKRLDALALKLSKHLDGEDLMDVARVCAGIAASSIAMNYPTQARREKNLDILYGFMRETLAQHGRAMDEELAARKRLQ